MSTIPEAAAAAKCASTLGLSVITNVARPDVQQTVAAEEVLEAAAQ